MLIKSVALTSWTNVTFSTGYLTDRDIDRVYLGVSWGRLGVGASPSAHQKGYRNF